MTKPHRRFCLCCRKLLRPDARNRGRQRYCLAPGCRQASKAASQRRWLSKPGNEDYFRGSANVARVQRWRKENPGYWKRVPEAQSTLQDTKTTQEPQLQSVVIQTGGGRLQDLLTVQGPLLVGLISQLVDSPLQETIEQMASRLVSRGLNVLGMQPRAQSKGNHENPETGTGPQRLRQVPSQFSWIDQRLVRQGKYLAGCSVRALALYLILVSVCDAEGLSYYSDRTLQRMLGLSADQLREARRELCRAELIVYESPLYQVLSLEEPLLEESPRANQTRSVAQILHQIAGGGR